MAHCATCGERFESSYAKPCCTDDNMIMTPLDDIIDGLDAWEDSRLGVHELAEFLILLITHRELIDDLDDKRAANARVLVDITLETHARLRP